MDFGSARRQGEGRAFIAWYNERFGTDYVFVKTGEAPDLYFMSRRRNLGLEIAPLGIVPSHRGVAMDVCAFVAGVESAIEAKCGQPYSHDCMLLVELFTPSLTAGTLESLCSTVRIPHRHPFEAIFVGARFPDRSSAAGKAYRCWRLA